MAKPTQATLDAIAKMRGPAQATVPVAPKASKMSLSTVTSGVVKTPYRLLIHGVDKVGKSQFAADSPMPIFLEPEGGSNHLATANRLPQPETWADVLEATRLLTEEDHPYKTFVIDSLDWLEPLLWKAICDEDNVTSIELACNGYGKGYNKALDWWRIFIAALERLQAKRGMNVIAIAHSYVKMFKNPEGEDYERYQLKLHDKASGLWREWAEGVYFANYETFAVADKRDRVKGTSTGNRRLYTQRTAAYDAGDRYEVPEEMDLPYSGAWAVFEAAAERGTVLKSVKSKAKLLGGEDEEKTMAFVAGNPDRESLVKLDQRLSELIGQKPGKVAA